MNPRNTDPTRLLKKFTLSFFVIFSFIVYALSRPFYSSDGKPGAAKPAGNSLASLPAFTATSAAQTNNGDPQAAASTAATPTDTPAAQPFASASSAAAATATPVAAPTVTAAPTAVANAGKYKNGTYTGQQVDAFYGLVQVQTTIQNGKIASVQFLQYPSDRRTSQRINSVAVPWLQQEAVQAQQANVDIISGATLTSQAFIMSLQTALDQAHQ